MERSDLRSAAHFSRSTGERMKEKNSKFSIVLGILGAIGTVFGILGIYFIFNPIYVPKPSYYLSNPITLSTIEDDRILNEKLNLTWNGENINNVKVTNFSFWNAGKQYMTNSIISDENPIRISINGDAKILSVIDVKKNGSIGYIISEEKNEIILNIDEGNSLEYMEGINFSILFTSLNNDDFNIKGKVFGSEIKFRDLDSDLKLDSNKLMNVSVFTLILLIILSFGYLFFRRSVFKSSFMQQSLSITDNEKNLAMVHIAKDRNSKEYYNSIIENKNEIEQKLINTHLVLKLTYFTAIVFTFAFAYLVI